MSSIDWSRELDVGPPPDPGTALDVVAEYYARAGYHVVPILSKSPQRNGRDWARIATNDPRDAAARFRLATWADGVGALTGVDKFVIDIDDESRVRPELRSMLNACTCRNVTRVGRCHYWFRNPRRAHGVGGSDMLFKSVGGLPGEVKGVGGMVRLWSPNRYPEGHTRAGQLDGTWAQHDARQPVGECPRELALLLTRAGESAGSMSDAEFDAWLDEHSIDDFELAPEWLGRVLARMDGRMAEQQRYKSMKAAVNQAAGDAHAGAYSAQRAYYEIMLAYEHACSWDGSWSDQRVADYRRLWKWFAAAWEAGVGERAGETLDRRQRLGLSGPSIDLFKLRDWMRNLAAENERGDS